MGFGIRGSRWASPRRSERRRSASSLVRKCTPMPVRNPSRIPNPESRHKGFTLIELMAVILLLAIAMTAVTFSFSKSLKSARVAAASRDLVAALRYTRGQAIVKGQQEVLLLNLDDNSYTAPNKQPVKLPQDMSLRLTTAEQEVTGGNSGGIRFFA